MRAKYRHWVGIGVCTRRNQAVAGRRAAPKDDRYDLLPMTTLFLMKSVPPRTLAARRFISHLFECGVLCLSASVFWAGGNGHAYAHGDPPGARAVLRGDSDGATVVLLDEGLAVSTEDGPLYVCPQADDAEAAIATALGNTIFTSDGRGGLRILSDDTLEPHPDWTDTGTILQLVANDEKAYALVSDGPGTRLFAVDDHSSTQLYHFDEALTAMAIAGQRLVVTGSAPMVAHWLDIDLRSTDSPPQTRNLQLFPNTIAVFPRLAGDRDFLVMLYGQFAGSDLAEVTDEGLNPLQDAVMLFSGPVEWQEALYIAYDGHLALLNGDAAQLLPTAAPVTCVGAHNGLGYACTTVGVSELNPQGLGAELFRMTDLRGPNDSACEHAWQVYRLELMQAGLTPGRDAERPATADDNEDEDDDEDEAEVDETASDNPSQPDQPTAPPAQGPADAGVSSANQDTARDQGDTDQNDDGEEEEKQSDRTATEHAAPDDDAAVKDDDQPADDDREQLLHSEASCGCQLPGQKRPANAGSLYGLALLVALLLRRRTTRVAKGIPAHRPR